jgi:tRNA G18 (ribose-2'-O)-methylase SpoU
MEEILVVLHGIRSVHNVGSIFRTADAAGVKKIYLCGITPTPLDRFGLMRRDFIKVSLGAEKTVAWEKAVSTVKVLEKLKRAGYTIVAVEQSKKSTPYYKFKPREKVALVMGSEVRGVPPAVLGKTDKILEIPMRGKKESLNVAVSFGIAVYRLLYN